MNKIAIISIMVLTTLPEVRAELFLVDRIDCVVCGPERNTPIVDTEITHKSDLNGQKLPVQQLIQQEIIGQQIISEKLPLDSTAADKYVESLKKQNNFTDSDLAELFEGIGRTFAEGLALLNDQYQHEMFVHHKFKSQVVATDDAIKEYHEAHPAYIDGWCNIQLAYTDFNDSNKEEIKKQISALIESDKTEQGSSIEWSSPVHVFLKDIANDKMFIFDMEPNQIEIRENGNTFELYKLIDKQDSVLKTIEECRSSIVDKLNRNQLEKILEEYNKEVHKFIDIIKLNGDIDLSIR